MTLYHYWNIGNIKMGDDVALDPDPATRLVWMTDMQVPMPLALVLPGEGSHIRSQVLDDSTAVKWTDYRDKRPDLMFDLELRAGAAPLHWWVSETPVRVTFVRETA